MTGIIGLIEGFRSVLSPLVLLTLGFSTVVGIIIGALPGLTATMGVSLLVGLTYGLPTDVAIAAIMGMYVGAIYGGSQSAILMNIPGTPSAAATALDGHPLALQGKGAEAIGTATAASFIGTLFGTICLAMITPLLANIALRFGAWEYFLLALFGIMICGNLTAQVPIKGWIVGVLGLAISTIGQEEMYGYSRFIFGNLSLMGGISLIPAMVGLFGISEVLYSLSSRNAGKVVGDIKGKLINLRYITKNWALILRSGIIGTVIGIIPGVGEDVAAWVSYDTAKRTSKSKIAFGTGNMDGIVASETANNACIGGALIPLLSLAIPGSAVAAVVLGAIWLHGVRPGPLLFFESPGFIYEMIAMLILASIFMLIFGLLISRLSVKILSVKSAILMPIVAALCVIGAYSINIRVFDIWVMLAFGLLGFVLRLTGYPAAPMTLGIILGPMADSNLRRALHIADGSLLPFVTRPISLMLVAAILALIVSNLLKTRKKNAE